MRIALFSPHYAYNYGAVLQAFALKEYLRDNGYDAIIFNRRPTYQCAIPSLLGRIARKVEELAKYSSFGKFEEIYLNPKTERFIFQTDLKNFAKLGFDAVIVGSDQIWRDDYAFNSFGFNLFLDFINDNNTLRISYAPSLGKDCWNTPKDVEDKVRDLLQKFDAISVREESSIKILKNKFDVDSTLVVDPTMLLTAEDYRVKFKITSQENKKYIAAYILDFDDNYSEILKEISKNLSMPVRKIAITKGKGKIYNMLSRFKPMTSVTNWVSNIANSSYVITNSFHGMVFSIIFRKQFIVFMNSERGGARFKSLLRMFNLENRLVDVSSNDYLLMVNQKIDYNKEIEDSISMWRNHSMKYLKESLQK